MDRPALRKAALLGFGLFGAQLMWMLYNSYMPLFLQAGSPGFANARGLAGFGFSAGITGLIMTLDNVAAFLIQPLMGPLSDRTRSRFGRRMPYIMVFAPLAALAFAAIPLGQRLLAAGSTGNLPFIVLMAAAVVMLVSMAVWRTPLFALLPDLFPSPQRSEANAIVNLMSGIGSIIAFVVGGWLFSFGTAYPFWFGSVMTLVAVFLLVRFVREPVLAAAPAQGPAAAKTPPVLGSLARLPAARKRSLTLLILAIFCYLFGYNSIETFFSSWAVAGLGVSLSVAAYLMAIVGLSFIVFAWPSARIAGRFGRKKAIAAGLLLFAAALLAILAVRNVVAVAVLLALGGFAWALININGLPMVLDSADSDELSGTYSGLYFIGATLAGTLGPILNGWIIDLAGQNYTVIFLVCPLFFLLSFGCLLAVRGGEVRASAEARPEAGA